MGVSSMIFWRGNDIEKSREAHKKFYSDCGDFVTYYHVFQQWLMYLRSHKTVSAPPKTPKKTPKETPNETPKETPAEERDTTDETEVVEVEADEDNSFKKALSAGQWSRENLINSVTGKIVLSYALSKSKGRGKLIFLNPRMPIWS